MLQLIGWHCRWVAALSRSGPGIRLLHVRPAAALCVLRVGRLIRVVIDDDAALELVDELPGDQREAVRARVIDERDYPDIAKDLRCSEAVVRKRVSRGLGKLRARLEEKT